jgi:hypothetical protein
LTVPLVLAYNQSKRESAFVQIPKQPGPNVVPVAALPASAAIDPPRFRSVMSVGEGAGVGFATMRGRDYPTIRQFTVFLENRVGQLLEVIRRFEGSRVRIVALSISDATECAFVRFLLSHPEQGREILERAGLAIVESDLIGLELPEGPNPLLEVCTALLQAEVNIVQAYPLMIRPHGRPAVALMVDNLEMALETLKSKNFTTITERDLVDDE